LRITATLSNVFCFILQINIFQVYNFLSCKWLNLAIAMSGSASLELNFKIDVLKELHKRNLMMREELDKAIKITESIAKRIIDGLTLVPAMVMRCPKCGSQRCVKAGFNHNRQRHICRDCGRQFTQTQDKNAAKRAFALYLYVVGLSITPLGACSKSNPQPYCIG
jgi:transposase-like protein